jgi:hypothetical protein
MTITVVVASFALAVSAPAGASAATLAEVRKQLSSWRLLPPPLFPARLPASFSGASVSLGHGFDFDVEFAKQKRVGSFTENYFAVAFKRGNAAELTAILHYRYNLSVETVQIGKRTVYAFETSSSGAPSVLAWHEQGRTYWLDVKYLDRRAALQILSPFVKSLSLLASACAGSLWQRLRCDSAKVKAVASCGLEIVGFGALKAIRDVKIIRGLYDTHKVSQAVQPVYKVYNDLMKLHLKNGMTGAAIWKKLQKAKTITDLVDDLIGSSSRTSPILPASAPVCTSWSGVLDGDDHGSRVDLR